MYMKKVLTLVLLFTILFSLFAGFVGESSLKSYEQNDVVLLKEKKGAPEVDRGTRAGTNIDFVSKALFGPAFDVHVVGNYAYVVAGYSLLIFDVSDTLDPILVGYCDTPSYANGVFVEGDYAYVANAERGLNIIDISTPSSPSSEKIITTGGSAIDVYVSGSYAYVAKGIYQGSGYGMAVVDLVSESVYYYDSVGFVYGITVSGDFAYLASWSEGLLIINITSPSSPTQEGIMSDTYFYSYDVVVSEPYAFVTDSDGGLVVVNITDKADPELVTNMETNGIPYEIHMEGSYAYIADEYAGLTIIDVSDPENPGTPDSYYMPDQLLSVFVQNDHVYMAAYGYGLRIADVSGELPPIPVDEGDWKTGYNIRDVHVEGDLLYIADGDAGLKIMDISDPYNPAHVGFYNPSDYSNAVDVEGNMAFVATIDFAGLVAIDVTDPTSPTEEWSIDTPGVAFDVDVYGGYAYVADDDAGLRIIDINTENEVGYLPAHGNSYNVHVVGEFAYIGDSEGLIIANVSQPQTPTEEGFYPIETSFYVDLYVTGSYAYMADVNNGLMIIDISDPTNPSLEGTYDLSLPGGVYAHGTTVYLMDGLRLVALDTSTISSPTEIGDFEPDDYPIKVDVVGDYAYVAASQGGLVVLDISQVRDSTSPAVDLTLPIADAEDVLLNTSIQVTFDENMDHDSAENAFLISPEIDGDFSWNGNTLVFQPQGNLAPETTFTVTINASAKDTANNPMTADYVWQFRTVAIPPVVESVYPLADSTGIPIDSTVIINFSKSMDKSSTQSAFGYSDGDSSWDASDGQVTWSNEDKTLTFTPDEEFENVVEYTFTIARTATDVNGTALDGDGDGTGGETNEDDYSWSFTTIPAPPLISFVIPDNLATMVPLDSNIIIEFTKPMNRGSVESAFSYTDGTQTWDISDGNVFWTQGDKNFSFNPSSSFSNEMQYLVILSHTAMDTDGMLLDGDGDGIPGEVGEDDYTWSFTTVPPPPQINSTFPQHGATMVPIDTMIIINFSKSIDRETMIEDAFSYTDGVMTYTTLDGVIIWSDNDRTMTFDPFSDLSNDVKYTFTIKHTVKDTDGTSLDGNNNGIGGEGTQDDYSRSFTTMPVRPKVSSVIPKKRSTKVAIDTTITVRFSKDMNQVFAEDAISYTYEGADTVWYASNGSVNWLNSYTIEFTPSPKLEYDTEYTVTINATAKDTDGITLEDEYTWSFTTIKKPPEVESVEPSQFAFDVEVDADILIYFDSAMNRDSTEKALSFTNEDTDEEFDSSSGSFEWSNKDKTLLFNPFFDFEEGVTYSVTLKSTAEDTEGIALDGDKDGIGGEDEEDDYSWSFTVKINSAPIFTGGVSPLTGDTSTQFNFSALYLDLDNDEPTDIIVVIDGSEYDLEEYDRSNKDYNLGKIYLLTMTLEEGEHEYYFEVSDGRHDLVYPEGDPLTVKVTKKEEESSFGFLKPEYFGMPTTLLCPLGIIILVVIIISVIMIVRKRRGAGQETMSFQAFDEGGAEAMSFTPMEEEPMTFTSFEEEPISFEMEKPVVIQCPECDTYLKVSAESRPFRFPCKCGAKLVLR